MKCDGLSVDVKLLNCLKTKEVTRADMEKLPKLVPASKWKGVCLTQKTTTKHICASFKILKTTIEQRKKDVESLNIFHLKGLADFSPFNVAVNQAGIDK